MITISDLRKQEEEEAKLYPELNQSLKILNEKGEWVLGREKEALLCFPRDFMFSGILRELSTSSVKVLVILAGLVGKQRFTNVSNKCISRYSGVSVKTIKDKALKELEYYHVIKRNLIPSGSRKRKRRIVLHRWDTAKEILIKEKKLKLDENEKVLFPIPNPYKK